MYLDLLRNNRLCSPGTIELTLAWQRLKVNLIKIILNTGAHDYFIWPQLSKHYADNLLWSKDNK
jgi:hypothetical protein